MEHVHVRTNPPVTVKLCQLMTDTVRSPNVERKMTLSSVWSTFALVCVCVLGKWYAKLTLNHQRLYDNIYTP